MEIRKKIMLKFTVSKQRRFNIYWFAPWFVAITLLSGMFFLLAQQIVRIGANESVVQLAEDLARRISQDTTLPQEFPPQKIEFSKSLATFLYLFDANKALVGTTASLNNGTAIIPTGVLQKAHDKGENRVTWQPSKGVRIALVATYFKGKSEGYIAVGRNLREAERLIDTLFTLAGIGWATTLLLTFITGFAVRRMNS